MPRRASLTVDLATGDTHEYVYHQERIAQGLGVNDLLAINDAFAIDPSVIDYQPQVIPAKLYAPGQIKKGK